MERFSGFRASNRQLAACECPPQDALRTFLLHKLDQLGPQDRSQQTMVATWACQLYLDKVAGIPYGNPCTLTFPQTRAAQSRSIRTFHDV